MMDETTFNFTMRRLEALPAPATGRKEYHDAEVKGLSLRVTAAGVKTFCVFRRVDGRPTRVTIGRFPEVKVEAARKVAMEINGAIVKGENPATKRRKLRDEQTLQELFDWYLADGRPKLKPSTRETYLALFKRYLAGLAKRKASQITKSDVRELHRRISKSAPYGANRMLALVRAVYNAAIRWDRFDGPNPAVGIERNEERSRETRLFPGQIAGFFEALDAYPDTDLRDFFWLCLLTGQRRGSLLAMRWADIHLADRLWVIPDTKNNRPQTVPLLEAEMAILERRKKDARTPWVFPGHGKTGHLVEPSKAWWTILDTAGVPRGALRIHDLRRSLGSFMVDAGASLPTIGKTLGHLSPLTTSVYARLCLDPVREAKQKAHDRLFAARDGGDSKVIELSKKRRSGAGK
jgi:integrase